MARYSSSRWSRPATGRQIAALKTHGNYDGKYYSMGRASQAIGKSVSTGTSRGSGYGSSGSYTRRPSSAMTGPSLNSLVADLLGVPKGMDALLSHALQNEPQLPDKVVDPVESVVFTLAPDETDPRHPRIQVDAAVVRNPDHRGDVEIRVQFRSNVEFVLAPPSSPPSGFRSGVVFDG